MSDFMSKHTRKFGLGVHEGHDASGDVDITSRQRKGIDLRTVQDRYMEFQLVAVAVTGKITHNLFNVTLQFWIVVRAVLLHDLLMRLASQLDFLLFGHQYQVLFAGYRIGGTA